MNKKFESSIVIDAHEHEKSGITILNISGEIDITTTSVLGDYIGELFEKKQYKIILNLKGVSYISSTGWGLFISLLDPIRTNEGDLKLAHMARDIMEIFNMTSLPKLISTFSTEEEAIASF